MRLIEIDYDAQPPIDAYGPGFFRVKEEIHQGHLLLTPDAQISWGGYDDLQPILDAKDTFDVIFIGTGSDIAQLPPKMAATLDAALIDYELMSSPSASRTYNVLLSEGRRIAAALLTI